MYVEFNKIYVNFSGSERVKVTGFQKSEDGKKCVGVWVYDMLPPGGKRMIERQRFDEEFAIEMMPPVHVAPRPAPPAPEPVAAEPPVHLNRKQRRELAKQNKSMKEDYKVAV